MRALRTNGPSPVPPSWGRLSFRFRQGPIESTDAHLRGYKQTGYRLLARMGFRSAIGFEIDIPTKGDIWASDLHPRAGHSASLWIIQKPTALLDDRLVVGIGILRSSGADIRKHLDVAGDRNLLLLNLPQALADGAEAQALVQIVKNAIAAAAADFRTPAIDLYYVGPAAFAVALGHRWNGLPATQLHEFVQAEGKYVPTAIT